MSVIISPRQKNATDNMLGPPLLNSKLDLGTAKSLRKLIRTPLKLLTQIELHTLSNFSFSVKAKKKKTQVMIQKDRSRKIEILAYWARNYLSISLLG